MNDKRLYSPKYVREILDRYGFKFSKSLGQNFLIDGNIVRKISQEGGITKDDYVLEIGPGIGTLTEELALNAKKVVSVEIDKNLLPILDKTMSSYDNVEIVHGDILKVDINKLIDEKLNGGPVKVVANLPYYVTTPIIAKLIEEDLNIESIIVMIQKEVADRMVASASTKQYGSLTIFVNFYANPEILITVPKTVFMPRPKVDSAVVKLNIRENDHQVDKKTFFKVVRTAFNQRRKTILNSLSSRELGLDKEDVKKILDECDISQKERAENLKIEDFIKISKTLPSLDIY
ncbi:16S rRNA (adenine(1518)-N(6)/adenine(1519)-N(6))-dimethyltransferase RsmA [Schnuerera sp. xch1]|uniref:16S rRNA (adenine(1518)-N(6)/adenine(1519)-N(6))- dimethyltransferase RsmA n=1 Tax=Schnuerera sp. xch1 TaxID=2874283 RepID=UPI001CBED28D|nr:16S rRNA (adenine(1518)-N(6)/adenine(1519)-N(6))-dimethyltransferase RsmA [Schnuerera sp. xch1]MBZ2175075.1 16S rRNA (adenine(1518)-N(6)/adenine(1519)-N(6))-dimethyltransferase RsmA [Schnuerera sp. xch1]